MRVGRLHARRRPSASRAGRYRSSSAMKSVMWVSRAFLYVRNVSGRGVGGAHDLAQRQVELRRAARHVIEDRVQAATAAGTPGRGPPSRSATCERPQVVEDVGEHQPGQVGVADAGREHVLDRGVRAVAELAELVDRLAVAVAGEPAGPGRVLEPVQDPVLRQRVQPPRSASRSRRTRDVLGARAASFARAWPRRRPSGPAPGAPRGAGQARAAPTGTRDGHRAG